MPKKLKVTKCPLGKTKKVKDKKCKKCEHYNAKRWFSAQGEVDMFCGAEMLSGEKKFLKQKKKK